MGDPIWETVQSSATLHFVFHARPSATAVHTAARAHVVVIVSQKLQFAH